MTFLVPIVACLAAGVVAAFWELRGAHAYTPVRGRGYHAGLVFVIGAMTVVALSPQLLLLFDRPLPVAAPANPHAGEGCSDDGSGNALAVVIALGVYLGGRLGPAMMAAFVRAVRGPPGFIYTGKHAQTVAAVFLGVVFPIVSLRIFVPGPTVDDFTTYGALTPDGGLRGWRAEHMIAALRTGPLEPLPILDAPTEDLSEGSHGHGSFSSGPHLKSGIHGWVAGDPVLIQVHETRLVGARVLTRDASDVPSERRPRFETWPLVAPRAAGFSDADGGWILVERRRDGSIFAMKVSSYGDADQVDIRDVWPLVRPTEIPHGITFALFLLGIALARAAHRRTSSPGLALLSAWIWLEAGALDLYYYAPYLGL
ncbi:MAG TPA: hypothetical protein VM261_11055 [Kofleriaceae bacterium]|nr:hypothetical protein [Kofleriaceae bacterium]